jgi:NADH:ubiquinone oxidoreductase subunit E
MIEIQICCGKNCSSLGGMHLLSMLEEDNLVKKYCNIGAVSCMNNCADGSKSPSVSINGIVYSNATPEIVFEIVRNLIDEIKQDSEK